MTSATLFMFGKQWDLLWINTNYFRHIAWDGSPTSEIKGGLLNFGFVTQERDEVFLHNTTKAIQHETDRMEKGEIHFYSNGDKDLPIRKYKFSDAYIIHICVTFEAYGPHNMQTAITLSPAIQNYGNGDDFIKYWQVSRLEAQPVYYTPEPEKKETRVKTIELKTTLDLGSANDTSGETQQGMLYGKTYEFKVVAFTQETPTDKTVIKWMYKYHSLSENKWIERHLSVTGDTIKFTLNEKDMCGRFVYIRAYIKDPENEGELKVWKHNRFRWFDRVIVYDEIKERTDNNKPWLVNQSGTSLCGMACIFYLFAKKQPEAYKIFAKELFRTGEATFNNYTVKPGIEILEKIPNKNDFPFNNGFMPLVDFITLAGTRNTDNKSYKGGSEEFQAINWPPLMTSLSEKLLGYKDVYSKGCYNPIKSIIYTELQIKSTIDNINNQFQNDFEMILMIDADLIQDNWDYGSVDYHWIVLESQIKFLPMLDKNGKTVFKVDFKVYSWGTDNLYLKESISLSHFMNNFYGYIKMKK